MTNEITIDLNPAQAERLYWAIQRGELKQYGCEWAEIEDSPLPDTARRPARKQTTNRILVIDDDPIIGRMIEKVFEGEARVQQQYGIPNYGSYDYSNADVIILDYQMPIRNGLEILHEIRTKNIDTPILFLTAFGDPELVERALLVGANRFVAKPISPVAIKRIVHELTEFAPVNEYPGDYGLRTMGISPQRLHEIRYMFSAIFAGYKVVGRISEFTSQSVVVEFPTGLNLETGQKMTDLMVRLGDIHLGAQQGTITSVSNNAKVIDEVGILVSESFFEATQ